MQQTTTNEWKTRGEWVGKLIHWELDKRLNFDYTTKMYRHKPKSLQENNLLKSPSILGDNQSR